LAATVRGNRESEGGRFGRKGRTIRCGDRIREQPAGFVNFPRGLDLAKGEQQGPAQGGELLGMAQCAGDCI
jgi:hypothetical protein